MRISPNMVKFIIEIIDSSNLDVWVFDHFEKLFEGAAKNKTLHNLLHSDKIVFFLQCVWH